MTQLAVFRADASPTIGGGHVMRCLALADGLAAKGWRCQFWVAPGTIETVPALAKSTHEATTATVSVQTADLLVVDHYGLDAEFESACRTWAQHILVIDDLADRPHDCDLLLDQTLGRVQADYRPLVPGHCRLLLGPAHALLRPDFARLRPAALARRDGTLARMLVSLGGSDPHDMTSLVLDTLGRMGLEVDVDVVLGSASPNCDVVAERLRGQPRTTLHVDTPHMAELMVQADLAIGAAGVTSWERCTVGLPTIMVVTADNQRLIAHQLDQAGAAVLAGDWTTVTMDGLVAVLRQLADTSQLAAVSKAAARVCDGQGVTRTVATLGSMQ